MTSARAAWTRFVAGSQYYKTQQILNRNGILCLDPHPSSGLPNIGIKRSAHFTYTPDPTDTTRGTNFTGRTSVWGDIISDIFAPKPKRNQHRIFLTHTLHFQARQQK